MKFEVKSVLPSAAIALVTLSTVTKVERAFALEDGAIPAGFHVDMASLDNITNNDSLGACDSYAAGDSFSAGDSFGCGSFAESRGVWTFSRDTNSDGILTPEVYETVCVKTNNGNLIAEVINPVPDQRTIAWGKVKRKKIVVNYANDVFLNSSLGTRIVLKRSKTDPNNWQGHWKNGDISGDISAVQSSYDNDYYWSGCDWYLGN